MTTERLEEIRKAAQGAGNNALPQEILELCDLAEVTIRAREHAANRAKNLRIRRKRPGVQPAATLPRVTAPRRKKTPTLGSSQPLLEPQYRNPKTKRL